MRTWQCVAVHALVILPAPIRSVSCGVLAAMQVVKVTVAPWPLYKVHCPARLPMLEPSGAGLGGGGWGGGGLGGGGGGGEGGGGGGGGGEGGDGDGGGGDGGGGGAEGGEDLNQYVPLLDGLYVSGLTYSVKLHKLHTYVVSANVSRSLLTRRGIHHLHTYFPTLSLPEGGGSIISIVAGKTKAGSNPTLAEEYTGSTALNVSFRQSRVSPRVLLP